MSIFIVIKYEWSDFVNKSREDGIRRAIVLANSKKISNEECVSNLENQLAEFKETILKLDSMLEDNDFTYYVQSNSDLRKDLIRLIQNYINILA